MATIVSTGQITIVDNNDAKPITAFITASGVTQQVYTKDDTTETFNPNWVSTPLTLTAKAYVGLATGVTEMAASLTNKKWSNDLVTSIGSSHTLVINTNVLTEATPTKIYYFEGDYTDPSTGLTSHVISQIQLNLVKTGTNAIYLDLVGINAIQESNTTVKNSATMTANLMRGSNIDDAGTTYKWFVSPYGATDQLDANHAFVTSGAITFKNTAGNTASAPADGTFADVKTIVISEAAVTDIGYFKVVAKSADNAEYAQYFVVYDVSDPYDLRLISTAGDKLQNGQGSTNIYPITYNGSSVITDTTGWTFDYEFYDASGQKGAFVDPGTASRTISSNTTGAFTIDSALTLLVNTIVKVISTTGTVRYYEAEASTGTTVTVDLTPETNTFCSTVAPTANQFQNGTLYVCQGSTTTGVVTKTGGTLADGQGGTHYTNSKIIVTGNDIDVKGTIVCKANRP